MAGKNTFIRITFGTFVSVAATAVALAADLPARVAPVFTAVPAFTWSGFYVGVNAGAGFNGREREYIAHNFPEEVTILEQRNQDDVGFTGGVQAGFNWQAGALVFGLEADINYIDRQQDSASISAGLGRPFAVPHDDDGGNWFGTVRPRVGLAFDRLLVFATGGVAFTDNGGRESIEFFNSGPPRVLNCLNACTFVGSDDHSNVGWVVGAGVEYAITNAMSLKAEYLHLDFGSETRTYRFGSASQNFTSRGEDRFDLVRGGVNFRF